MPNERRTLNTEGRRRGAEEVLHPLFSEHHFTLALPAIS